MVVSYRLGWFTYQLARRLVRSPFVALPNILAGRELVPELLQDAATPAALAAALTAELHKSRSDADAAAPFVALHEQLRQGADANAAAAVLRLVEQRHP
jgi:lipid-A-disaccharide synthase